MTRRRSVVRLGWRAIGAVLALSAAHFGCGDDSPNGPAPDSVGVSDAPDAGGDAGACTPGEMRSCQLDLLCAGTQTCAADGSGFGACECPDMPLGGGAVVGTRCESDADCTGGAFCMRADENVYQGAGGPARGYCTFTCEGEGDCEALDPESTCGWRFNDGSQYCARTCLSKDPEDGEAKCLNRSELVCLSRAAAGAEGFIVDRQQGLCMPRCGSDADCPEGRVCHLQGGICTTVGPPGGPIGARCELDRDCSGGECGNRVDGVGICTASCVVGSLGGCGYAQDVELREAACLAPLVAAGGFSEGAGDLGLCRELCDEAADCERFADGFVCDPLSATAAEFFGRSGACVPAQ